MADGMIIRRGVSKSAELEAALKENEDLKEALAELGVTVDE